MAEYVLTYRVGRETLVQNFFAPNDITAAEIATQYLVSAVETNGADNVMFISFEEAENV